MFAFWIHRVVVIRTSNVQLICHVRYRNDYDINMEDHSLGQIEPNIFSLNALPEKFNYGKFPWQGLRVGNQRYHHNGSHGAQVDLEMMYWFHEYTNLDSREQTIFTFVVHLCRIYRNTWNRSSVSRVFVWERVRGSFDWGTTHSSTLLVNYKRRRNGE